MLHRVTSQPNTEPSLRPYDITPSFLESCVVDKLRKGYRFVSMDDIYDVLHTHTKANRLICVTLDDGYKDNYTEALPVFQKYNIPFTIYVATGYVDGSVPCKRGDSAPLMSIEEVRRISRDSLCTIGAHTVSHCRLGNLTALDQKKEIASSIQILEAWIGKKVAHFAPPYGSFNETTIDVLKNCGIKTSVMAWGGAVRMGDSIWSIPRVIIEEDKLIV